ncbi:MAG: hypothetical protein ABF990_05115 [Acetobacter sp.]|uniref:hypothetical protein n=1 Tax=Acetobacter sp. TaxID=440 RepID=UPI0039ED1E31
MSYTRLTVVGDGIDPSGETTPAVTRDIVINATAGIIIDLASRDRLTYLDGRLIWPSGTRMELDAQSRDEIETETRKGEIMSNMIMTGRQFFELVQKREAEAQARREAAAIASDLADAHLPIAAE